MIEVVKPWNKPKWKKMKVFVEDMTDNIDYINQEESDRINRLDYQRDMIRQWRVWVNVEDARSMLMNSMQQEASERLTEQLIYGNSLVWTNATNVIVDEANHHNIPIINPTPVEPTDNPTPVEPTDNPDYIPF